MIKYGLRSGQFNANKMSGPRRLRVGVVHTDRLFQTLFIHGILSTISDMSTAVRIKQASKS